MNSEVEKDYNPWTASCPHCHQYVCLECMRLQALIEPASCLCTDCTNIRNEYKDELKAHKLQYDHLLVVANEVANDLTKALKFLCADDPDAGFIVVEKVRKLIAICEKNKATAG